VTGATSCPLGTRSERAVAHPASASVPARRRILDTAHRLFATEGVQAVGVDRIVAEAHVVKATLYRHFQAKDDLVCAYLAELSERQLAALRRLPADAELPHALVEIVGGPGYRGSPFSNAAAEYPDPDHPVRQLIAQHRRAFRDLLAALPGLSARPDARTVAGLYLVLCEGLVTGAYLDACTDH
jgi:AcrR family transcriptional regulator